MDIETTNNQPQCMIQLPSSKDLSGMQGMPAGLVEDQSQRLGNMVQKIQQLNPNHPHLPLVNTDENPCSKPWLTLFTAIQKASLQKAIAAFNEIPLDDSILMPLLQIHPKTYLIQLIEYCIKARPYKYFRINQDVTVTTSTFEVLIKDLATTLHCPAKTIFSFGLPSHHAYSESALGFCIINKPAVLLKHLEALNPNLRYVFIGTDVNRDNGLCNVLLQKASNLPICHIDSFDSRVYPYQGDKEISKEFNQEGNTLNQKINYWQKDQLTYYKVDLSLTTRAPYSIHPALVFAIETLLEQLELAKAQGQQVVLLLPTGWDSHVNETAPCGKWVNGHEMSTTEANKTRFKDSDLSYFYDKLFTILLDYKDSLFKVYWGLEGGYNQAMYEKEIALLLEKMKEWIFKAYPLEQHNPMLG